MSIEAMAAVWERSQAKAVGHELLILLALADCANPKDGNVAYPSLDKLSRKVRLDKSRVCKILSTLEVSGELLRQKSTGGRNRRTRYVLTCLQNSGTGNTVTGDTVTQNTGTGDMKTVVPVPHALNRNRTVSKKRSAESVNPIPVSIFSSRRKKATQPDPAQIRAFEAWYSAYPRHVGKKPALQAWLKLNPDRALLETIMTATGRYVSLKDGVEDRFILHPATWLNQERWTDEAPISNVQQTQPQLTEKPRGDLRYGDG